MRSRRNCSSHTDYEVLHSGSSNEIHVVNSLIDMLTGCLNTVADSHLMMPRSSADHEVGSGLQAVQHARTVRPDRHDLLRVASRI